MSTNKSFSTETSERYSRALFEVSRDSDDLEKVENDIKNFKLIYDKNSEVRNFIKDPSQIITEQNKLINLISDKLNFSKNFQKFLLLLIEKRRIFLVNKIIESFLKLCSKKRGEIKASLISSKELSQTELNDISTDLSKSMGSTLKFDWQREESMMFGAIMNYDLNRYRLYVDYMYMPEVFSNHVGIGVSMLFFENTAFRKKYLQRRYINAKKRKKSRPKRRKNSREKTPDLRQL